MLPLHYSYIWRVGWDLNPRTITFARLTVFKTVTIHPLSHLPMGWSKRFELLCYGSQPFALPLCYNHHNFGAAPENWTPIWCSTGNCNEPLYEHRIFYMVSAQRIELTLLPYLLPQFGVCVWQLGQSNLIFFLVLFFLFPSIWSNWSTKRISFQISACPHKIQVWCCSSSNLWRLKSGGSFSISHVLNLFCFLFHLIAVFPS